MIDSTKKIGGARCVFLALLFLVSLISASAQTADKKWNIGLHGGAMQYRGDLGNDFYSTDKAFYGFGGVSVSRYLGKHLDLSVLVTHGEVGYLDNVSQFNQQLSSLTANFRFNFFGPDTFIRPYLFAGGGAMMLTKNLNAPTKRYDGVTPSFGAGINIKLGPTVMLNVQEMFMYSSSGNTRGSGTSKTNDAYLFHTVGFTFNFGNTQDQDGDGVADRKDKCSDTPKNAKVDKAGCPVDTDKDGVADFFDACPDLAGTVSGCPDKDKDGVADKDDVCPDVAGIGALKGCPDADGDGIEDSKDECPTVKGVLAFAGCPDTDEDGIKDSDDKCPEVKGVKEFEGCPDTDGDGVPNSIDMCPNLKGQASSKGCPDTDLDGIHNGIDRCPTVAGVAANQGCPELKKEVKLLFQQALQGIKFEAGKAKITPTSFPILNSVAKVMTDNSTYKLLIGGHTDNVGNEGLNQTLSQDRADAVGAYLIGKGISPMRIASTGYGLSNPVDDNKTAAGRARNRRVELKVEFIEKGEEPQ